MTEPTLSDCINYMKQQLKGMEKYPKSYEYNIPYYRKTIELLETRGTTNGNCATCVKAVVIDERPHGKWIPCSERLPDRLGDYLVSDKYGDVYSTNLDYLREGEKCFGYYGDDGFFIKNDTVIAWQPLPEPYKKEGDSDA